jgi:signal transduction histidine kinase
MEWLTRALNNGVRFVRENPQLLYTLSLLVIIPLAFFFTSEQFVRVSRETQDRLERSRVGLLEDVFAEFAGAHITESQYLTERILHLASTNETITNFSVIGLNNGQGYTILASKDPQEIGQNFTPDPLGTFLLSSALGNPEQSYAAEHIVGGFRHWRVARVISAPSGSDFASVPSSAPVGYVLADISMAEADRIAEKGITQAYLVLLGIILLILILLARQARIVDYASLYRRLKEVDQMKDDFVSMAAHELRSPLAVIRAYVDELREEKSVTYGGKNLLARIDGAAQSLNALVGDILDVAKLQEGCMSFRMEALDANTIITSVAEGFAALAKDKKLAFSFARESLPKVSLDPDRFRQVMTNLIGNAVKYTPSGEVKILTRFDGELLEIRVSDTGIGISAEEQQKLFQKFYRVRNEETSRIQGTGLGLWITNQMVQAMKGVITIESIKGKGTDMIVRFPLA